MSFTSAPSHACNLGHCRRCGECIETHRTLCNICRQVSFELEALREKLDRIAHNTHKPSSYPGGRE